MTPVQRFYLGRKFATDDHEVFAATEPPTDLTHGKQYASALGPFLQQDDAVYYFDRGLHLSPNVILSETVPAHRLIENIEEQCLKTKFPFPVMRDYGSKTVFTFPVDLVTPSTLSREDMEHTVDFVSRVSQVGSHLGYRWAAFNVLYKQVVLTYWKHERIQYEDQQEEEERIDRRIQDTKRTPVGQWLTGVFSFSLHTSMAFSVALQRLFQVRRAVWLRSLSL